MLTSQQPELDARFHCTSAIAALFAQAQQGQSSQRRERAAQLLEEALSELDAEEPAGAPPPIASQSSSVSCRSA